MIAESGVEASGELVGAGIALALVLILGLRRAIRRSHHSSQSLGIMISLVAEEYATCVHEVLAGSPIDL